MKSIFARVGRNSCAKASSIAHGNNFAKRFVSGQSVRLNENGDSSVLKLEKQTFPALQDGQVLVENQFAGLNFIDTYQRSGLYKLPLPTTLGMDGAGL